jgi:hypothetical protein
MMHVPVVWFVSMTWNVNMRVLLNMRTYERVLNEYLHTVDIVVLVKFM